MKKIESLEAAAFGMSAPDSAAAEFMYMPAGTHTCTLGKGGQPVTVTVLVNEAAVDELNAQLAAVNSRSPQKAFLDFDHDKKAASFWPAKFTWRPDGVYVSGEWTKAGKEALEGKTYRAFSPTFYTNAEIPDKPLQGRKVIVVPEGKTGSSSVPAEIVCNENAGLCFGGLVNNPAFEAIQPLFAKSAEAAGADKTSESVNHKTAEDQMNEKIAELQAALKNLESKLAALEAKSEKTAQDQNDIALNKALKRATEAELATAKAQEALNARLEADADAEIAELCASGIIPPQDENTKGEWKKNFIADPTLAKRMKPMWGKSPLEAGKLTPGANSTQVEVSRGRVAPKESAKRLVELTAANAKIGDMKDKLKHSREMYALYAKEIRGNDLFNEMPLEAATAADTVGTLAGTLVAQRTIELYKYEFPALGMITTDYSDQPAQYNQTTTTRIVTVPAIMTYSGTIGADGKPAGWTIGTPAATTDVSITINNHKGVEVMFDANTLASTARRLFDEQAEAMAYALGKDLVDALYAVITAANFPDNAAFTEAAVDFGRRTFSKCSRILNNQGAPFANRFALINSSYFEKLEQDPTLVSLAVYQKPEIISDSRLPKISRFTPIEAPNLPTTGNMAAFFGHKSSLMVQTRVPNDYTTILPGASYGQVVAVTNPDTGVTALLVNYVSHPGGYASSRLAWMYGVAKAATKGGQIVKSA